VWYGDTDPNTFFPRCYKLSCDEEKTAFIGKSTIIDCHTVDSVIPVLIACHMTFL